MEACKMNKIIIFFSLSIIFSQNPISVSPDFIDFGSTSLGEIASYEVSLYNSSNELLTVNIESTSGNIYSLFPSVNVPANGSSNISLNYSPSSSGVSNAIISFSLSFQGQDYTTSIECIGSSYTTISGGEVSGNWDTNISPIIVQDDILVPAGQSLNIEPGVVVYFEALKSLTVEGDLTAIGNYNDKILFTSLDQNTYWNGLSFINSNQSSLQYIVVENVFGDFHTTNNLMRSEYWSTSGNVSWNESGYRSNGGGSCTLNYPILFYDIDTEVQFYFSTSNYSSGNGSGCMNFYGETNSVSFCDGQGGYGETILLNDHFTLGETITVRMDLADAYQNNYSNFSSFTINKTLKSAIHISNSELEISNSSISNNYNALTVYNSNVNILNTNFINNVFVDINQASSTLDLKNSILYSSPNDAIIITTDDSIYLSSYNEMNQFPYFLNEDYQLDPILSSAVDSGDPNLSDECIPPGLNGIRSDIGMYGGPNNCGSLETNIPNGKPIIDSIVDIPQDQGGFVGIQYQASGYENILPIHDIIRYSFWRDLNVDNRQDFSYSNYPNSEIWYDINNREYWEYIGDMVAQGFNSYGYTAPTIADSNIDGEFISTFIVIAHTSDEDVFFVSDTASGESIDNLAPDTPEAFSTTFDCGTLSLGWSQVEVEDLENYKVYRSQSGENNYNLLYETRELEILDEQIELGTYYDYKISATDSNGNESELSSHISGTIEFNEYNINYGANLIAFPFLPEDSSVGNIFMNSFDNTAFSVIGEGVAASLLPNGMWVGSLTEIIASSGYWVIFNQNNQEILTGCKVNPETVYDLNFGQNLISYPFDYNGNIADVLPDDAEQHIVSIIGEGVAASKFGNTWVGSLSELKPGEGYWFKTDQSISFAYEDSGSSNRKVVSDTQINDDMFNQSTSQAFYFMNPEILNSGDLIVAYNGETIVGARNYRGKMIDVPVMGDDGFNYSEGYCKTGDKPIFRAIKDNGEIINLSVNAPAFEANEIYVVNSYVESDIPLDFKLSSAYPNPFNPTTSIEFSLPSDSHVSIKIYDMQAREIAALVDNQYTAGIHTVTWNADDYSSGIYFMKMMSENFVDTQKLMLIK